jgi:hypothetical protein
MSVAVRLPGNAAYAAFREALLDFSDEPTPLNLERYLDASRALDGAAPADDPSPKRSSRKAQRSPE